MHAAPDTDCLVLVPSLAAVLQADSTTQSALSFKVAIFDAVKSPSSSGVACGGGNVGILQMVNGEPLAPTV
jgi:hypothetical protein